MVMKNRMGIERVFMTVVSLWDARELVILTLRMHVKQEKMRRENVFIEHHV